MIAGIICEYNPLHNGHVRHIKTTKEKLFQDGSPCRIVCAMSGNFTQRGDAALLDKFTRAAAAIRAGADMVVEIPPLYATSGAKYFARGGVETLLKINGLSALSFGTESADAEDLIRFVRHDSGEEYQRLMRGYLSKGLSYTISHLKASEEMNMNFPVASNDILGAEYIASLIDAGREDVQILAVKRDSVHNSTLIEGGNCSSSAIRAALKEHRDEEIIPYMPSYSYDQVIRSRINYDKLLALTAVNLIDAESVYEDNEGIINRVRADIDAVNSFENLIDAVHTKRYTLSRIRRVLIHIALRHTRLTPLPGKVRVLAVAKDSRDLLSALPVDHSSELAYEDKIYNIVSDFKIKTNSMLII